MFAAQFAAEGNSGLVSLECDPALSHDTEGTIAEARRLWNLIGRPNAMIKIPATDAGLAALPDLVADGININLTLLFSRAQTVRAYQAYQQGLAQRTGQAAPQLVASFFISRIDTALDPQLPPHLQGKTALALAQAAYRDWQQFFGQPSSTVPTARLLWASTGVKNPAYSDTLYVDNLIAPHTVNTLPDAVLHAFTDHGRAADALSRPAAPAQPILDEIAALGIDLEALAAKLQQDGLAQFEQAFSQMLAQLAD